MLCRRVFLLLALLFGPILPSVAWAYSVLLHDRLPDVLAADPELQLDQLASLPDDAGLAVFRKQLYALFTTVSDAELRERFLDRYPDEAAFSDVAFKEFLGSSAIMPALGFDTYEVVHAAVSTSPELPAHYSDVFPNQPRSLLEWIRLGSTYPDLDGRNQSRWWVLDGRFPLTRDGNKIPYDPVILNMGRVEGLSGQAHAHYGLNDRPKSDDPAVLKSAPADFAVAAGFDGPVLTFAPERAQAYADLAILAQHLNEPALAALFAGNSFHYLADLANQIHTIQVGVYRFFIDATLQVWKMKLLCLWGLRCDPPDLVEIGLDIISNHHLWLEEYFRIAVEAALAGRPLHASVSSAAAVFAIEETAYQEWLDLPAQGPLMHMLAQRLIAHGNEEGPQVYTLARSLTKSDLRKAGVSINFSEADDAVTLQYLKPRYKQQDLATFLELQTLGTRRAATAMLIWWRAHFATAAAPDWRRAVNRLLQQQLAELDAADQRRAQWIEQRGGLLAD